MKKHTSTPIGFTVLLLNILVTLTYAQKDYIYTKPLEINVNAINFTLSTSMGDGGMASMYSWNLTGDRKQETEEWFFPQDQWYSNMLFHLYNILCYSDSGYVDREGVRHEKIWHRSEGFVTDYSWERRRYAPPKIIIDGIDVNPPYRWEVDPTVPCDIFASFEDIYRNKTNDYGGVRVKVNVYATSNQNHDDYIIWEETIKFTGELFVGREVEGGIVTDEYKLPDQTINLWWGFTSAFGPTKAGEYFARGYFGYEPEDDLDSWFSQPSVLVPNRERSDLIIAYYWDTGTAQNTPYSNDERPGWQSDNDAGDPDRTNGHLYSSQIPGFTILECQAPRTSVDDLTQPYAAPHANIVDNFFGRRFDYAMRDVYIGHAATNGGKWPKDVLTEGLSTNPEKGTMRVLTVGPYDLTKDSQADIYDSIKVVYAIGVGDIGYDMADSLGRAWFRGDITDAEKDAFITMGRDSLFETLDRANWAWANGIENVPTPPPPPDIEVTSGPGWNKVEWSYPTNDYFDDFKTGVDDWYAWRVYRKIGAYYVDDPDDNHSNVKWQPVFETTNRNVLSFIDSTAERGVSYYYAVTAIDNGTQNTTGLFPEQKLESSRYANRSSIPAIRFEPGLNISNKVRVVPNPASIADIKLGSSAIKFYNLPVEATLKVYTETGEWINTIRHYGSADELWDLYTNENQIIVSGIYILVVTDAKDIDGNRLPDQFVKFIIVR